jgi:hypothetical protein
MIFLFRYGDFFHLNTPNDTHTHSARRRDLYLHNTQHSEQKNIHALGGIRTRNPSIRASADLRLRSRRHWGRHMQLYGRCNEFIILSKYSHRYKPGCPLWLFYCPPYTAPSFSETVSMFNIIYTCTVIRFSTWDIVNRFCKRNKSLLISEQIVALVRSD